MAQETAQGEKRLKKMVHSDISSQIYFDGRKNTTPKVRPTTSETEEYVGPVNGRGGEGTALPPAPAAAAAASGKGEQWLGRQGRRGTLGSWRGVPYL